MENSSYNNGQLLASELENKCLRGNRSSKKDHHRKINTARGLRDRRMRLSLDVAKRFFKLQDLLGFDKASNTIKWLLMNSKHAIQDLAIPSASAECEILTEIVGHQPVITTNKEKLNSCTSNKEKKRNIVCVHHSLAKETREKARERARKRATEKRSFKLDCGSIVRSSVDQVMDQSTNRLEPWVPFGDDQVRLTDQIEFPNSHLEFKERIVGDYSSMLSSNWNPSFLFNNFNYQHDLGPCNEHQFSDLQILGNPWEGINN